MNPVRKLLSQFKPVHWVVVLVLSIAMLMPVTPRLLLFIINHAAENQGYKLSYQEADLSPFKGILEYRDLEIHTGEEILFGCGHCLIEIDISEAFSERYVVHQALISSARLIYTALPEPQAQETGEIPYWQIDQLVISQLDLVGLPKVGGQTISVKELTLDNLNRDSKLPGTTKADIQVGSSQLAIGGQLVTAPALDFESIEISLKQYDVKLIPATYRILKFENAGVIDLEAKLSWANRDGDRRRLHISDLDLRIHDGSMREGSAGIHSMNGRLHGTGQVTINTSQLPQNLIYEEIAIQGGFRLSAKLASEGIKDHDMQIDDMQLNLKTQMDLGSINDIRISGNFDIPSLDYAQPKNMNVSGNLSWNGDTHIQQSASGMQTAFQGALNANLAINPDPITEIPEIKLDRLKFEGEGSVQMMTDKPTEILLNGESQLATVLMSKLAGKSLQLPGVEISDLVYKGETSLAVSDDGTPGIDLKGDGKASMMLVQHLPGQPGLQVRVAAPDIRQLSMSSAPLSLHAGNIDIDKILLTGETAENNLPITGISLDALDYRSDRLAANKLSVDHVAIDIQRTREGSYLVVPEPLIPAAPADKSTSSKPQGPATRIFIKTVTVGKDSHIQFSDYSVQPAFKTRLVLSSAQVNQLAVNEQKPTEFKAKGVLGERGTFTIEGNLQTDEKSFDLDAASKLSGLSLKQYSPYTSKLIGYQMDKGYLDLDINTTVKQEKLDGNTKLKMTGLKVTSMNNEAQKDFDKSLGLSLHSAISMLEDKKGHIDLTVPIGGDISNPDFGMGDIISKALGKGIKGGLLITLQPLGLAVLAVDALSGLGGIPLGEVSFEPGSTVINSVAAERLTLLAEKMKEKPGMQLKACALALENELPPGSKLVKPDADNAKQSGQVSDPEFTRKLASERLQAVQKFLSEHQISQDRLVTCAPEVVKAEGNTPSVKLILADSTITASGSSGK
jgi:hypothetical protein